MYKTLTKKILELENEKSKMQDSGTVEIQDKIKKYNAERTKIINMFPENFFNNYSIEE